MINETELYESTPEPYTGKPTLGYNQEGNEQIIVIFLQLLYIFAI